MISPEHRLIRRRSNIPDALAYFALACESLCHPDIHIVLG